MNHIDTVDQLRFLKAYPIHPADDGFHGAKNIIDIEWWYFDAVFDNEYSVHVGFRLYHIKGFGVLQQRINIYYKGTSISETKKRDILKYADSSKDDPNISVKNNRYVSFDMDHYKKTDEWRYHISLDINDVGVDLVFTGATPGWKIETDTTCWTVPLPKAKVTGTITLHGKPIEVSGVGYHDHNWGYSPVTVIQNQGWYWGRITSETLHLTWANTISSRNEQDLIAVLNKEKDNTKDDAGLVHSVHPKNINFSPTNFSSFQKFQIPYIFHFAFEENDSSGAGNIAADITMKTVDVHYNRIFIIHYWRYHVKTNGILQYGDITEKIVDKPQIIEFLSFKEPRFKI